MSENIDKIPFDGLIYEMNEWTKDHSKKLFRQRVIRIYTKCLVRNKILLATKIAEKYRKELTSELRSDMAIAANFALFANNLFKTNEHR
jgi:hypothetical protein